MLRVNNESKDKIEYYVDKEVKNTMYCCNNNNVKISVQQTANTEVSVNGTNINVNETEQIDVACVMDNTEGSVKEADNQCG